MQTLWKAAIAMPAIAAMSLAAMADTDFVGVWRVKDSSGKPFEITLSADGGAKGTRAEGMTGSWEAKGDSAVIRWNTGWATRIEKEGNRYKKTAYSKGRPLDGPPTNSSDAEKVE